jgi:hypothetical protein
MNHKHKIYDIFSNKKLNKLEKRVLTKKVIKEKIK